MFDTYVTRGGRSIISTLKLASSGNAKSLRLASICGTACTALSQTDRGCCSLCGRVCLVSASVSARQRTSLRRMGDSYGFVRTEVKLLGQVVKFDSLVWMFRYFRVSPRIFPAACRFDQFDLLVSRRTTLVGNQDVLESADTRAESDRVLNTLMDG